MTTPPPPDLYHVFMPLAQEIADSWEDGGDPSDSEEMAALLGTIVGHVERSALSAEVRELRERVAALERHIKEVERRQPIDGLDFSGEGRRG
jgi:hypothetical protein